MSVWTLRRLAKSHILLTPKILIYIHLPFVGIHNREFHLLLLKRMKTKINKSVKLPDFFINMIEINKCDNSVIFPKNVCCCLFVIFVHTILSLNKILSPNTPRHKKAIQSSKHAYFGAAHLQN